MDYVWYHFQPVGIANAWRSKHGVYFIICFGRDDRNNSCNGNLQFVYYEEIQREVENAGV